MKKILLTFAAILAATFVSWAQDGNAEPALDVNVTGFTPAETFEEDGSYLVTVNYDITGAESLIIPDLILNYELKDAEGSVLASGEKNAMDINDGYVNIYFENLTTFTEYQLNITKITVFDYMNMDYDTFETPASLEKEGNLGSIEFSILDVKVTELIPDSALDPEDGSFKVTLNYQMSGAESLIIPDMVFSYEVTDATGAVVASGDKNPADIADGSLNIYVDGLVAGSTYKLTVTKITVYDYANMDWDTYETPASLKKEGDLGSVEFTVPVSLDVMVSKLIPDNALDAEDGSFKVVLEYQMTGAESLIYPDLVFNYEVTDAEGNVVDAGTKNPSDVADGSLNIFVNGLETGKEYKLTVTKITVYDYANMDWDTYETPASLEKEGDLGCVEFSINPTGIENSIASQKESRIFSINGMELRKVQKGLNIVNGKKILVK